ncbi:hypothetical protein [Corynebacterium bouchesdurhonense]|uniref:hypothetical protein n=1 Tax=Corynebacterium bouchesdurhonense TaxID=1720192 RepID=UPI00082E46F9|nr:hypothetical protein [Corynebacterium bouchesdurhonense]
MHRRSAAAVTAAALAAAPLAACGGDSTDTADASFTSLAQTTAKTTSAASSAEAQPTTARQRGDAASAWKREYEYVLDHPGDYPVNPAASYQPTGFYSYALVEATGGGAPELLLKVESEEFSPVIVFTIGENGKAVASTDVLISGARGAGGSRTRVDAAADGTGLYQVDSMSTGTTETAVLFTLDGTSLANTSGGQGYTPSPPADRQLVIWTPTQDRQPLELGELTTQALPSNPRAANANATSAAAPAAGQVQLTGTVRAVTGAELQAGSGRGMPNGEDPQSVYYVLWFDSPQDVTGKKLTEYVTNRQEYAALGMRETMASGRTHTDGLEWADRVGQRVTLTVDQDGLWYPTDAGMPLGAVRVGPDYSVDVP